MLLLNAVLGGVGKHVKIPARETAERGSGLADVEKLIADMKAGKVSVLRCSAPG